MSPTEFNKGRGPTEAPAWLERVVADRSRLIRVVQRVTGGPQEAEEVVQEAMVRAWRGRDKYDSAASARGWVVGIARNVALDRKRTCGRRRETSALNSAIVMPSSCGTAPSLRMRRQEEKGEIQSALRTLSEQGREVVWMRHREGLSFTAIAQELEIPESTARKRYSRALAQLRGSLL